MRWLNTLDKDEASLLVFVMLMATGLVVPFLLLTILCCAGSGTTSEPITISCSDNKGIIYEGLVTSYSRYEESAVLITPAGTRYDLYGDFQCKSTIKAE